MNFTLGLIGLFVGLFFGMLALMEVGRRVGLRRLERASEGARTGVATAEGAVFALLGLLVAFTFSGAATRFQDRRRYIMDESNAVGTAWLRLDLVPQDAQTAARESMRRYVDARLDVYRAIPDLDAVRAAEERVSARQAELWGVVVDARAGVHHGWELLVMPALNEMFDLGALRTQAMQWHLPSIVLVLLCALALACSWLAGFGMAGASRRPTAHMLAFATVVTVIVFVIVDLEFPRLGFLRVDVDDQVLIDVRSSMR